MIQHAQKTVGRPRKPEEDKVQYQRIAVYAKDYSKLVEKKPNSKKITEAFTEMVEQYQPE